MSQDFDPILYALGRLPEYDLDPLRREKVRLRAHEEMHSSSERSRYQTRWALLLPAVVTIVIVIWTLGTLRVLLS
jgi:hypothetical protein